MVRLPKLFLSEDLIARLYKNAGILLLGNVGAAIIGFASLAVTARALGASGLGTLVLVTTYVLVIDRLINFQTWQALIKYGAEALNSERAQDFKSLLKFGYVLDIGAAIAGSLIAASAAWFFGGWYGWDSDTLTIATVYSLTILSHISGVPIAVLRLFDRFKLLSIITFSVSLFKLIGVAAASLVTSEIWAFLIVWGLTDLIGNLMLLGLSQRELKIQGYVKIRQASLQNTFARFPGLWSFVISTNLNGSIRLASKEADVFFVGILLTPAAVGLYKVAKQIANVLVMLLDPLYQAIYPALTKLNAAGDYRAMLKMSMRAAAGASIFGAVAFALLAIISESLLFHAFGQEFIDAKNVLLWYGLAVLIAVASFPVSPLIMATGSPNVLLLTLLVSTTIYFSVLPWLIAAHGQSGAGIAYVVFYLSWVALSITYLVRLIGQRNKKES